MKYSLFVLFCLMSELLLAQSVIYQSTEVDSTAVPHGGIPYLNTFLQANLRKPIDVQAKGTGGRLILSAIVEPDGRVSEVKVVKSLHPKLNQEAVRVFSSFGAWKPAQKAGIAVRQQVFIPVAFVPNQPFLYENGSRINYYDAQFRTVPDSISNTAQYKEIIPMDSLGVPNGDVLIYGKDAGSWVVLSKLPLVRKRYGQAPNYTYTVGNQKKDSLWHNVVYRLDGRDQLISRTIYNDKGTPTHTQTTYHPNGIVAETTLETEKVIHKTSWYINGQLKEIEENPNVTALSQLEPVKLLTFFDSTGRPMVIEGNGEVVYRRMVQSLRDTSARTEFIEKGKYVNGLQEGVWTGGYADGSFTFEERYDKGACLSGQSSINGKEPVNYTTREQPPTFPGGVEGIGQFLSRNLSYPATAQKAGAEGKVFVSFVVCTDGTLCDYEVLKSAHPDLDREAVRVVKKMSGRWKPGVQRGRPVRVKFNLPINFSLN